LSVASLEWEKFSLSKNKKLFDLKIITDDGHPVTSFNGIKIEPYMGKDDCR